LLIDKDLVFVKEGEEEAMETRLLILCKEDALGVSASCAQGLSQVDL
jgi:hypothetical protein